MPAMTPAAGARAAEFRPRLVCPPISPSDLEGSPGSVDADAIRRVAAHFAEPASSFGLELKVAHAIEARGLACDEDRLRRPFFRLAQEPIVWSWWDALQRLPLDRAEMLMCASMLNGAPVGWRQGGMFSHGGGLAPHVYYETPAQARSWIEDIASCDRAPSDPVKKALYRFARIVFAHPFTDANGRFARAALQAGLARQGVIATPCLALAPVFHLQTPAIRTALRALGRSGRWDDYFDAMGAVLGDALNWVRRVG